jgi:hypothetical protein
MERHEPLPTPFSVPIASDQAAGDDADHARMPAFARDDDGPVCAQPAFARFHPGDGLVEDNLLDGLALLIMNVELGGDGARFAWIGRGE